MSAIRIFPFAAVIACIVVGLLLPSGTTAVSLVSAHHAQ